MGRQRSRSTTTAEFILHTVESCADLEGHPVYGYYHVTATDFSGNNRWANS